MNCFTIEVSINGDVKSYGLKASFLNIHFPVQKLARKFDHFLRRLIKIREEGPFIFFLIYQILKGVSIKFILSIGKMNVFAETIPPLPDVGIECL